MARMFISIGIIVFVVVGITLFLHTTLYEISPIYISIPVYLFVSALVTYVFRRSVKNRQRMIAFIFSFALILLIPIVGWRAVDDMLCSSNGRVPISQLQTNAYVSGDRMTFCGYLQSCEHIQISEPKATYEVCLIHDTRDTDASIQFYNMKLSESEAPLVQISHDSNSLTYFGEGALIVRTGIIQQEFIGECLFPEVCNSQTPPFAEVYHTPNLLEVFRES